MYVSLLCRTLISLYERRQTGRNSDGRISLPPVQVFSCDTTFRSLNLRFVPDFRVVRSDICCIHRVVCSKYSFWLKFCVLYWFLVLPHSWTRPSFFFYFSTRGYWEMQVNLIFWLGIRIGKPVGWLRTVYRSVSSVLFNSFTSWLVIRIITQYNYLVIFFLSGVHPTSEYFVPTFRNTLPVPSS
jgi:hypothetical protein